MQSEFNRGVSYMRDNVIGHIIGMQNDLGNNVEDKGYQKLEELLDLITERYGNMFGKFTG